MTGLVMQPVQRSRFDQRAPARASQAITERAYEVYGHLYGTEQTHERLHERGGFGAGELIAFLYARSFPREEWRQRANEAFKGLENI